MGNELERSRVPEITEYLRSLPVTTDQGQHVHVHHHYAPAPADTRPVDQNPGQAALDKYAPYFILLLGGTVILAIVAVIAAVLLPLLVTMMIGVAACFGCLALLAVAVSSSLRNMRLAKLDQTLLKKVTK